MPWSIRRIIYLVQMYIISKEQKSRLKALNNKRFPKSNLRQYIPKRADSIFFEDKGK